MPTTVNFGPNDKRFTSPKYAQWFFCEQRNIWPIKCLIGTVLHSPIIILLCSINTGARALFTSGLARHDVTWATATRVPLITCFVFVHT